MSLVAEHLSRRVPLTYAAAPLPEGLAATYARYGYQTDVTLGALMERNAREFGDLRAVIDDERRMVWREVIDLSSRFAGFLTGNGIGPGDVVTWQLPNWWEAVVAGLGIFAAGAISNPIVPIYREHELAEVLEAVHPACIIAPQRFRGCDHAALWSDVAAQHDGEDSLKVVVRGVAAGWTTFADALRGAPTIRSDVDPDAPALVGFTSGTTSGAKGVVHSTRTLLSFPSRMGRAGGTSWKSSYYIPLTVAHATGMLGAIATPLFSGCSVVLRDRWVPDQAILDMEREGVTDTGGPAVFLEELMAAMRAAGKQELNIRFGAGGSSIPSAIMEEAEASGMQPRRGFGMTECPTVSSGAHYETRDIRLYTDGRITAGVEIRVVDADGIDVPPGENGEFLVRGPQRALGYLSAEDVKVGYDDDGWFHTGDLGHLDGDVLSVTGRAKEIINRGGEKLSAREIEELVMRHPSVLEAAVVAAPHPRLGEQPAAFIRLNAGCSADAEELQEFIRAAGLAHQKIPQVWRVVDDLPRTPSGKVKKYVLEAELRSQPAPVR